MNTAENVRFAVTQTHSVTDPGSIASLLARTADVVRRWLRMRRAIAELRELDDRLLDDIGLSHSTLHARARERHGFATRDSRDR